MDDENIVEGVPRQGPGRSNNRIGSSRYGFSGTNPYAGSRGVPKLQFGEYGELTPKTIEQAGLQGEERKRAQEILKVQAAYIEIYHNLDYPNDPDGHVVDLSGVHMTQPKVAIAWTLALLGFRSSGRCYIKKRHYGGPGVTEGAYTWVDARAADDAAEELLPEHRSSDHHLPPDTRRLAAQRDGDPPQDLGGWAVTPVITEEWVCSVCGRALEPNESCPHDSVSTNGHGGEP
ncbi:MAG TPA: hypothetical protein VMS84_07540 [Mycobacterium sp.]|jgi:hypothetical protein|nr:hypothetical protein [Mycobacterium sp.]